MWLLGFILNVTILVGDPVQKPIITDDERTFIAYCVEAEAGNQGLEGKQLVVDVILNRVESSDFPDTVYDVITQKNAFSVWKSGALMKAVPTEETFEAIDSEIKERTNSEIVYFNSIGYMHGTPWKKVGAHYFSY